MDFLGYALVIAIGWFLFSNLFEGFKAGASGDDGKKHCMTCGIEAVPTTHTKGSFGLEVVLWLLFIVPGLIYSVWRVSSRQQVCASCGGSALVRIDSPAAINQRKTMQS